MAPAKPRSDLTHRRRIDHSGHKGVPAFMHQWWMAPGNLRNSLLILGRSLAGWAAIGTRGGWGGWWWWWCVGHHPIRQLLSYCSQSLHPTLPAPRPRCEWSQPHPATRRVPRSCHTSGPYSTAHPPPQPAPRLLLNIRTDAPVYISLRMLPDGKPGGHKAEYPEDGGLEAGRRRKDPMCPRYGQGIGMASLGASPSTGHYFNGPTHMGGLCGGRYE